MTNKHYKIRFSKRNIKNLKHYPSANNPEGIRLKDKSFLRSVRYWAKKFIYSVVTFLILISLLGVLLLKVGISGDLLAGRMQEALQYQLSTFFDAEVKQAALSFDENYHLALKAQNVNITNEKNGISIDKIALLKIGLSSKAILMGKIKVAQLEIDGVNLFLPKDNQSLWAKIPKDDTEHINFKEISKLLFALSQQVLTQFKKNEIQSVVIRDIAFYSEMDVDRPIFIINKLIIKNHKGQINYSGQINWQDQFVTVLGNIGSSTKGDVKNFDFQFRNLDLHLGAANDASAYMSDGRVNHNFFRLNSQLNAHLMGQILHNQQQNLSLALHIKNGETAIGENNNIYTQGHVNFLYSNDQNGVKLVASNFSLGHLKLNYSGFIQPETTNSPEDLANYRFGFNADNARIVSHDKDDPDLLFSTHINGRILSHDNTINFSEINLKTNDGTLTGAGSLKFGEGSPEAKFLINIPQMPVENAKKLWPINLSPGARNWIISHIYGGMLTKGQIVINFGPNLFKANSVPPVLTKEQFNLDAQFSEMSSSLIGDLPDLKSATGQINIAGTTTKVLINQAFSILKNRQNKTSISDGKVIVSWRPMVNNFVDINFTLQGKMDDAIRLASLNPINAQDKIPIEADDIKGNFVANLALHIPIGYPFEKKLLSWQGEIKFDNVGLHGIFDNALQITNANGTMLINNEKAEINAQAALNDIPAQIQVSRMLNTANSLMQEFIKVQLTDQLREKYFPNLNSFVKGPIDLIIREPVNNVRQTQIDLTNAQVTLPFINWQKKKGIRAQAQFTFLNGFGDLKNTTFNNFNFTGDSFNVSGTLSIKDGALNKLILDKANFTRDDDLSASLQKQNDLYNISIKGNKFDARSLIASLNQNTLSKTRQKLDLKVNIKSVLGFHNENFSNLSLTSTQSENINRFKLTATSKNNALLSIMMNKSEAANNLRVESQNAGSLLRFFNFYDKMYNGNMKINLTSNSDLILHGPILVRNFKIINEPRLSSLVSKTTYKINKKYRKNLGEKIDLSIADMDLFAAHISKGDNFLILEKGVLRGSTIGATFQGIVFDAAGNISMTGTFMPLYGLNRMFSNLPIIGDILGNGRDRGLIGLTFRLNGKFDNPQIIVNPLSVIAPGVFRQIFEFQR